MSFHPKLDPNYRVAPPARLRPQPAPYREAKHWGVTWSDVLAGSLAGLAFGGFIALCILCA